MIHQQIWIYRRIANICYTLTTIRYQIDHEKFSLTQLKILTVRFFGFGALQFLNHVITYDIRLQLDRQTMTR